MSKRERRADRSPPGGARPVRAAVAPAPGPETAPPLWRDPWALATALAVVPLLVRCAGAPLGEPVAEDFDFLRRSLFFGLGSLFDGGGSTAFWRPLAHQVYYAALGPLIVSHPRLVAALHALLLAAGSVFVFRALRSHLGAQAAAVAAAFPMFSESTRTLVAWPSQFVDVGLYFFSAVALYATARRRLAVALAATLLALLCKELAIVTALLLPWLPDGRPRELRRRWALGFGALLLAWGATYLAVRHAAGLALPHGLEQAAARLPQRVEWAFAGTLRALVSLPLARSTQDSAALVFTVALVAATALTDTFAHGARARLRAKRAWIGWGAAWFVAGTLALAPIFPLWQPNRAQFASVGFGVVAGAASMLAHPALAAALVLGRGALLFAAPPAAPTIAEEAPVTGAFMDFAQLSRLERFMHETHTALRAEYPRAEPRASLIEMNLPRGLIYALGGDHAVQVWYRDTTLRMVNFAHVAEDTALSMIAGVQFQPHAEPQVVMLSPAAMRAQDAAYRHLVGQNWEAAIAAVDRADSLAADAEHVVFHANNAGYRALALYQLHRFDDALAQARRSVAGDDRDQNGSRALATLLAMAGHYDEAMAEADRLLGLAPGDPTVARLRAGILAAKIAAAKR